mgnify:FL=1
MEYMLYRTGKFQLNVEKSIKEELDYIFEEKRHGFLFDYCRGLGGYVLFFDNMDEFTIYSSSTVMCVPVRALDKIFVDEPYAILKDYKI